MKFIELKKHDDEDILINANQIISISKFSDSAMPDVKTKVLLYPASTVYAKQVYEYLYNVLTQV